MTERNYVYRPLQGNLRIKNKCQILARPAGENYYRSLGDNSGVTLSYTIEETEVYSNETPDKDLAVLDITKAEPVLGLTLRQVTDFAARIMFMTDAPQQSAPQPVSNQQVVFVGMVPGDVARLDHGGITEIDVSTGGGEFVEGTHFQIDRAGGSFELLALPEGGAGSITVKYDAEGIALPVYGMMNQTQIRASILIRQNNKYGRNFEYTLWDVQLRPDGEIALGQDGDDFGELSVNGRLFADPTQPAAYRFGRVRELPNRVL